MTSKCTRINKLVKILDRRCVFNCCLNPFVELVVKVWTLFHCKKQDTRIRIMTRIKKKERRRKEEHLLKSKRTKQRGLPLTQQPRDVPPKVIRKCLLTVAQHEKISGLPVIEGRRKISDETRLSVLGDELVIPKLSGFFQTIKVDELVHRQHIPIRNGRPDDYTAYDYSPGIRHKLPRCEV